MSLSNRITSLIFSVFHTTVYLWFYLTMDQWYLKLGAGIMLALILLNVVVVATNPRQLKNLN